jgi:uncharacterized protein YndB with AHSA1/START domain/DNA-binding transcriptional ArsR family regulator
LPIVELVSADDLVFRALADPTRRALLDRLRLENGQTLTRLGQACGMTRQAVTQHLSVLQQANLVTTVRQGRERLHYLNPVPLHDIQERWIGRFEQPRLTALSRVRKKAEMIKPSYVYVTYIQSTPEKVWEALTDADLTASYWGHRNESQWGKGDRWAHVRPDGSGIVDVEGDVVEVDRPHRLVVTWEGEPEAGVVTYLIEPFDDIVRLTVTHENLQTPEDQAAVAKGWPAVMANLKSLLETGRVLSTAPWTV